MVMKYYSKGGSFSRGDAIIRPYLDFIKTMESGGSRFNVVNVNSLIQYTNPRDTNPMPPGKSPQRRHDMEYMTGAVKDTALANGLTILDTKVRSDPRWFSTHDGIHYTAYTGINPEGVDKEFTYQWTGGVSHMNVVVFTNMLCNRECNA